MEPTETRYDRFFRITSAQPILKKKGIKMLRRQLYYVIHLLQATDIHLSCGALFTSS